MDMNNYLQYELVAADELVACIRDLSDEERLSLSPLCSLILDRVIQGRQEGLLALDEANAEPKDIREHFLSDEACYLFWYGTRLVLDGKSGADLWLLLHSLYTGSRRERSEMGNALFNAELALASYGVWLLSQGMSVPDVEHRLLSFFSVGFAGRMFAAILDAAHKSRFRNFYEPETVLPSCYWKPFLTKKHKLSKPKEPLLDDILASLTEEDKKRAYVRVGGWHFFLDYFSTCDCDICPFTDEIPDMQTAADKELSIIVPLADGIRMLYALRPHFRFSGSGADALEKNMLSKNKPLRDLKSLCDIAGARDERYCSEERTWRKKLNTAARSKMTVADIDAFLAAAVFPRADVSQALYEKYAAEAKKRTDSYLPENMARTWRNGFLRAAGVLQHAEGEQHGNQSAAPCVML